MEGLMEIEGEGVPENPRRGMEKMAEAARLGNMYAQQYLGDAYANGKGVAVNRNQSVTYFRLCAAQRQSDCQYRLAELMLSKPDRKQTEFVQSIVWLNLAADKGHAEARRLLNKETLALTPAQMVQVSELKKRINGLQ